MKYLQTITYMIIIVWVEAPSNFIWVPRLIHVGRLTTIMNKYH
jgi:hypothetical protein